MKDHNQEITEYQPDAREIEERGVPGGARWVLYLIFIFSVGAVVWATVFRIDRIVVARGELITSEPTIVVQPLSTSVIRTIQAKVGDVVEKGQLLATLDPTFASADLSQLQQRKRALSAQLRRIKAELEGKKFSALPEEGIDGVLQEEVLFQRQQVVAKNKRLSQDRIAGLKARIALNKVQQEGLKKQEVLLRDIEGTVGRKQAGESNQQYRLRVLEAQRSRQNSVNSLSNLIAEAEVTRNELRQARSEWERFLEERQTALLEEEVQLRAEQNRVLEELHKAERLHDLITLRAPAKGIVLKMAERSVGSIIQQAEPFMVLVPFHSVLEAQVDVSAKDIGRIRPGDDVRVKFDAFPFQRHDTLPGKVRVISENAFSGREAQQMLSPDGGGAAQGAAFYRCRVNLLGTQLKNVPDGFRLMPGMKVQAEIKVGTRSVISYFLYPVIRVLDEGLREP